VELVPGGIQFSVADSGMGISRAEIPFVFGQFWQSQKTTAKGTGLGLFIARGIVESHGGWIWAESKPGSGSRFSFVLPLRGESLKVTS
jgi:signal transduction histidine kinase